MLDSNLLPLSEKKEIKIEQMRLSIISFSKIIFLFLFLLAISLLSIYFYLEVLVDGQEDLIEEKRQTLSYKEIQVLDQEINTINSEINKLYNIQRGFTYFSPIVEEIDSLIPESSDVYLMQLNITPEIEVIPKEGSLEEEEDKSKEKDRNKEEDDKDGDKEVETIQREFIKIDISGFAPRRKNVLDLKNLFKNSSMFSDVVSPVENIIPPTNIDFNFTFRLNDEKSSK